VYNLKIVSTGEGNGFVTLSGLRDRERGNMNIVKKLIRKIQGKNPYTERELDNADLIVAERENLSREQRKKRFDDWYRKNNKKNWEFAQKTRKKRTI
jgi:hypothetical protein